MNPADNPADILPSGGRVTAGCTLPGTARRAHAPPLGGAASSAGSEGQNGQRLGRVSTQATIGDTDHCPACWLDQLPTAAVQPIAVLPPRTQRWWRHARYICPQCSHGWWRPLPAYPDLPPIPERPKRKSNKRRSKEGTS